MLTCVACSGTLNYRNLTFSESKTKYPEIAFKQKWFRIFRTGLGIFNGIISKTAMSCHFLQKMQGTFCVITRCVFTV
ncbi:hypothetical protein HanRHA438_Chr11g0481851 [Helianthus annuus]|nr:hypothetical protein HanRHA438_Chr11g0481851 [Helianthus annuus]